MVSVRSEIGTKSTSVSQDLGEDVGFDASHLKSAVFLAL